MEKNNENKKDQNISMPEKYKGFIMQMAQTKSMRKSFKNIKIRYKEQDGLGLYCKDSMAADQCIFTVPEEVIITIDKLFYK